MILKMSITIIDQECPWNGMHDGEKRNERENQGYSKRDVLPQIVWKELMDWFDGIYDFGVKEIPQNLDRKQIGYDWNSLLKNKEQTEWSNKKTKELFIETAVGATLVQSFLGPNFWVGNPQSSSWPSTDLRRGTDRWRSRNNLSRKPSLCSRSIWRMSNDVTYNEYSKRKRFIRNVVSTN